MARLLSTLLLALSVLSHGLVPGAHRASPSPTALLSRRDGLKGAAAAAASLLPVSFARADDLDEDDPDSYAGIVGSASGMKKRTKPGDKAASLKATAADVKEAFADITAARSGLAQVGGLLDKGDFAGVTKLLAAPPFSSAKASLSTIVRGPTLGGEEKKAIGNEKRFGTGADVLIMLGGITDSANLQDAASAKGYVSKARRHGQTRLVPAASAPAAYGSSRPRAFARWPSGLQSSAAAGWAPQCRPGASPRRRQSRRFLCVWPPLPLVRPPRRAHRSTRSSWSASRSACRGGGGIPLKGPDSGLRPWRGGGAPGAITSTSDVLQRGTPAPGRHTVTAQNLKKSRKAVRPPRLCRSMFYPVSAKSCIKLIPK